MPITAITYQNNSEAIVSAYRPIIYRCKANNPYEAVSQGSQPQTVFCDIYVDDIYYKSLWKSHPIYDDEIEFEYEFDIQDAIQEVLTYNLPPIANMNIIEYKNTIKKVFVKFRNTFLVEGFIHSEQSEPIQGTLNTESFSGGGKKSNSIYVLNILIQHEDKLNVEEYLKDFKTGIWKNNTFPLTKRPKINKLCKDDSSFFPIITSETPTHIKGNFTVNNEIFSIESFFEDKCPFVENINYTSKIINEQRKKVILSWDKIKNIEKVSKIIIYYREVNDEDWMHKAVESTENTISFNVNNVPHDYRFDTIGSCITNESGTLPFLSNKITSEIDELLLKAKKAHESQYAQSPGEGGENPGGGETPENPLDTNSAKITNKTHIISDCELVGQKTMFNIEGDPDQIVKFQIDVIENTGSGFQFKINNAEEIVFDSIGNTNAEGLFYLNEYGINEYYASLCLNPCSETNEVSISMIKLTLFNMDNTKLSTQSIIFAASQNCINQNEENILHT